MFDFVGPCVGFRPGSALHVHVLVNICTHVTSTRMRATATATAAVVAAADRSTELSTSTFHIGSQRLKIVCSLVS